VYSEGNVEQVCYPRSALKFFQQLPLLLSGAPDHFGFSDEEIAIMCGSHNGENEHLRVVKSILAKIGLNESNLLCGAQAPTLKQDYYALVRAGEAPRALHNNCSGKHAGFLAWCVYNNADVHTYLEPGHPLHIEIKRWVTAFYELPETTLQSGIDGCSAPIFAMPVKNQAIAYRNLAAPDSFDPAVQEACARIRRAVSQYPLMIAGTKRYCTDLMRVAGNKIVGKTGADGVYCIGIPDKGLGIAIKIDDGKMGPQYHVAQQLLHNSGVLSETEATELEAYLRTEQKNFAGRTTGWLRVNTDIRCRF
jgi:L-asparaginase II